MGGGESTLANTERERDDCMSSRFKAAKEPRFLRELVCGKALYLYG